LLLKNELVNHGTFTILFLGSFLHLQAQNDSLKNKKIYSFGYLAVAAFLLTEEGLLKHI